MQDPLGSALYVKEFAFVWSVLNSPRHLGFLAGDKRLDVVLGLIANWEEMNQNAAKLQAEDATDPNNTLAGSGASSKKRGAGGASIGLTPQTLRALKTTVTSMKEMVAYLKQRHANPPRIRFCMTRA